MSFRFALLLVIGFGLALSRDARADIPPPLPPAKHAVTVKIEVDENAKGPKLIIPNQVFMPPRGRPLPPRNAPKSELNQQGETDTITEDSTQPKNSLLVVGLALALSMAFGGMWLLKRNGKGSMRSFGVLIAVGAGLTIGAAVWANAPPPPLRERPAPNIPVSYPTALEVKADVEFIYGAEPVRLILDKESYEKLKKGELKMPEKATPNPAPANPPLKPAPAPTG